jgi:hypothetical protein
MAGTPSEPADLLHFFLIFSSRTGSDRAPSQGTGSQLTGNPTNRDLAGSSGDDFRFADCPSARVESNVKYASLQNPVRREKVLVHSG